MDNKDINNKESVNDKLINIIVFILWIAIICMGIISIIAWKKTNDFILIISGIINIVGILFNIYLLSRKKSKK